MSERKIPATNEIKMFFHCANCMKDKPVDLAPRDWAAVECGWTVIGFQAWCMRCNLNIVHVDFEGAKHPANMGVETADVVRLKPRPRT